MEDAGVRKTPSIKYLPAGTLVKTSSVALDEEALTAVKTLLLTE